MCAANRLCNSGDCALSTILPGIATETVNFRPPVLVGGRVMKEGLCGLTVDSVAVCAGTEVLAGTVFVALLVEAAVAVGMAGLVAGVAAFAGGCAASLSSSEESSPLAPGCEPDLDLRLRFRMRLRELPPAAAAEVEATESAMSTRSAMYEMVKM